MLRVWNIILAILSYLLAVFGTFLTRSGVVQSVHAFAQTDIGWVFLAYIGVVAGLSIALLIYRLPLLRPEHRFESFLSREAVFLFNNLLLLAVCFATFWGVMFPVFSEALTGEKAAVGPPFFNRVNTPLFLLLLLLMGIGPLLPWRKGSLKGLVRLAAGPAVSGSLFVLIGMAVDPDSPLAALSFGLAVFVFTGVLMEFSRAMRARRELGIKKGVTQLVRSRPRYFGGMIVHAGVAAMAVAITASMGFKIEKDIVMKAGERAPVGGYELELERMDEVRQPNYTALVTTLAVYKRSGTEPIATLHPERRFYPRSEEVTSEVDIRMTLLEDLYVALAGVERPQDGGEMKAVMKVFVNPLQIWLWFGAAVVLFGTAIVFSAKPAAALEPLQAAAREPVEA
jgi:cytochrome c-type biogenesis protein CcmF